MRNLDLQFNNLETFGKLYRVIYPIPFNEMQTSEKKESSCFPVKHKRIMITCRAHVGTSFSFETQT